MVEDCFLGKNKFSLLFRVCHVEKAFQIYMYRYNIYAYKLELPDLGIALQIKPLKIIEVNGRIHFSKVVNSMRGDKKLAMPEHPMHLILQD